MRSLVPCLQIICIVTGYAAANWDSSSQRVPFLSAARGDKDPETTANLPANQPTESDTKKPNDTEAPVGVKAHKKSNAVGDPDGEGSDDSDSESSDLEEWEEEALEERDMVDLDAVQVELELVEEEEEDQDDENALSSSGGGVGVRLGQRLNRRKSQWRTSSTAGKIKQFLKAWQPHIYLPPSAGAASHLKTNARAIDGSSKARLDRRTLYDALLLEWMHAGTSYRKFLDPPTSQALQSALSLATQPQWRRAFPRQSAIRLYDEEANRGCTLAMQETIAMAMVRISRKVERKKQSVFSP
jgi:hypothetical protein